MTDGTAGAATQAGGFPFQVGIAAAQTESWATVADRWRQVEALGFDSAWLFDHFMATGSAADHTYLEAWTALAGLAALTTRLQLGVLVTGNTYRSPALLAKQAATVDHISRGRLILGLGAGWHEPEHRAYGFPFSPPGERVSRFKEAVQLIRALFREERATFTGRYYQLEDAPFEPKPVRPGGIPLVIGTRGPRMLGIVAQYADIWNMVGPPERVREHGQVLLEACARVGRDPATIRWSAAAWVPAVGFDPLASVEAFRDLVGRYREQGVSEIICQWRPELEPGAIERIAAELPALRG
jgi:F420-dependent oxidoreductase-like protein